MLKSQAIGFRSILTQCIAKSRQNLSKQSNHLSCKTPAVKTYATDDKNIIRAHKLIFLPMNNDNYHFHNNCFRLILSQQQMIPYNTASVCCTRFFFSIYEFWPNDTILKGLILTFDFNSLTIHTELKTRSLAKALEKAKQITSDHFNNFY